MSEKNTSPANEILAKAKESRLRLADSLSDALAEGLYARAGQIANQAIEHNPVNRRQHWEYKLDKLLLSKLWGFPIMFLLFALVFWITIIGANYPSAMLAGLLVDQGHPLLKETLINIGTPTWITGLLADGMYLATAWVVSVMLPPMAIFFPMFTLLEDWGYLPRVAFNLDSLFGKVGGHGKQSLSMMMGFGCNAAGVVATRIIDSPRERLIAIITNNFALCNGRWPTQILIASLFIGVLVPPAWAGVVSAMSVVGIALLGVGLTLGVSFVLSRTVLKGQRSSFSLELPPYRPPRFWQTIYTSIIDRTLIVLWRAIVFALPAGAVIWLVGNVNAGGQPLAWWIVGWLQTPAHIMGLTGIILLAYIIAIPANEIVIPTVLMLIVLLYGPVAGVDSNTMFETNNLSQLKSLLAADGWTLLTGINLMLFSLIHNPCSTTIYTIYKETKSPLWTSVSALMPIIMGVAVTASLAFIWRLF